MSNVGFQEYRLLGGRTLFKRKTKGSTEFPMLDIGTIETPQANINTDRVVLEDSDGGLTREVDEANRKVTEDYQITGANLNLDNLAIIHLSDDPTEYGQAASYGVGTVTLFPGRLVPVQDSAGNRVRAVDHIIAITDGGTMTTATNLTAITKSTKTFSFSADPGLTAADKFVVPGLGATLSNTGTYTVASTSGSGPYLVVTVETPGADQSSATITWFKENAGTIYAKGTDWDEKNVGRGLAYLLTGGAVSVINPLGKIYYATEAVAGKRILTPQSLAGELKGDFEIYFSAENFAQQWVRSFYGSMAPAGTSLSATDFSKFTLGIRVISKPEDTVMPAGTLERFYGDLATDLS